VLWCAAAPVVSLTLRKWTVLALVLAVLAIAAPAWAQDDGPDTSIRGTVQVVAGDERTPVEGVTIRVTRDGSEVGESVTDAEGTWEVAVPSAGTYQVTLEVETLPDDVAAPTSAELGEVAVRDGQNKTVRFNLGPGRGSSGSFWDKVPDRLVNGLTLGALVALAAVGLSLVFGVTELTNFAHGEFLTVAAAVAYFLHASSAGPEWMLLIAAVPAIAAAVALAWGQERAVWRPLRRRRVGTVTTLVTSIGLSFAIRNVVLVVLGGNPVTYRDYAIQDERSYLGLETVPKNVVIVLSAVAILAAAGLFLQRTRAGVAVRAVADNRELAESSGIDVNRVIMITWLLGGTLAGLAGVYLGVSTSVQWDMGFNILLLVFAAVVLGGLGTAFGAMLGGFLVGLMVELSTLWLPTELKNAVAMAALIAMLLWRPQGLLGSRGRIG
jgi:neutral amino acid transport system permease protein